MESVFDLDKPYFVAWLELYDIDIDTFAGDSTFNAFTPPHKPGGTSSLYYAALCGFQHLVQILIVKYPQHVNASGGSFVTPLVASLARKHFQTAELLQFVSVAQTRTSNTMGETLPCIPPLGMETSRWFRCY
jgi:hypothetical protein